VMPTSVISRATTMTMVALLGALLALGHPLSAQADAATILSNRVNAMLSADPRLNGASCYTASTGVIVLYGTVFDAKARDLAEAKARKVHGVKQVINTLRTKTGKWLEEESRINDTLLLNSLQGVSARVIGNSVYVSGQVSSAAEQQRVLRVIGSVSQLQIVNFTRIVPGPMF
jgi:osmotically-inducible protein OsmY